MNTLIPHRKRLAGFTLIEMAIVLLISGILMSAGLALFMGKMAAAQVEVTQKRQEVIKQALINYLGQKKRLPCPAANDSSTGLEDRPVAVPPLPPCSSYYSMVPYQTLGLDRAAVLDGWENFITYVVSPPAVSTPPTPPPLPTPPWTTAWLYTYSTNPSATPCTTTICSAAASSFWPSTSAGGITVKDGGGNTIADPLTATGAVVALISHGKNGYGAYNVKATQNSPTPAGANEQTNASPITGAPASPLVTVYKRDTTDSTAGGGAFDDVVMILSANDLIGPLVANGKLQSNAQAALSQANDIVLGSIVSSSKRSCTVDPPPAITQPPTCIANCICTTTNYYYIIPTPATVVPSFPASVTAWGMNYATGTGATYVDVSNVYSSTATIAYTLTAGDGAQQVVSVTELHGKLIHAGSN